MLPPEPGKDHFTFYRLVAPDEVPAPSDLDAAARVDVAADGLGFRVTPGAQRTVALEVRLDPARCPGGRIVVRSPDGSESAIAIVPSPFRPDVRFRVPLKAIPSGASYEGSLQGCGADALVPPFLPRSGFILWDHPRERGTPAAAVRVLARAGT